MASQVRAVGFRPCLGASRHLAESGFAIVEAQAMSTLEASKFSYMLVVF